MMVTIRLPTDSNYKHMRDMITVYMHVCRAFERERAVRADVLCKLQMYFRTYHQLSYQQDALVHQQLQQ